MTLKVDCRSEIGTIISQDCASGAMRYDATRGALYKAETQQEYLLTNQDRVVRYDGAVKAISTYDEKLKIFLPTNALRDGEALDRTRVLSKKDILAKPTWAQVASDTAVVVAQGAVAGAVVGAVGGAIAATVQHMPARSLRPETASASNVARPMELGLHRRNLRVHTAALHANNGPFHPGDLNPPPPWMEPIVPGPGAGSAIDEAAREAAWAGIGAMVGEVFGPGGAVLGAVIGAGLGAAFDAIF